MINLGLVRISRLLKLLAKQNKLSEYHPTWRAVHIAGTNGKGSVAAYIAALLSRLALLSSGKDDVDSGRTVIYENHNTTPESIDSRRRIFNVGRFTSPHFINSWDCIQINNQSISFEAFDKVRSTILPLAEQVEQELLHEIPCSDNLVENEKPRKDAHLTEFELLTANAFELFSSTELGPCNLAVIECGLGGRLDATNVLPSSVIQLSVITRIGLDHLNILGGSLRSIVREKCGILRENVPVVVDGDNDPDVLDMIRHEVVSKFGEEQAQHLFHIAKGEDIDEIINEAAAGAANDSHSNDSSSTRDYLSDLMPHQRSNLAVALKVCKVLGAHIPSINATTTSDSALTTLVPTILDDASKSYPGRLQWLRPGWIDTDSRQIFQKLNTSTILLDGAHNVQSAQVLRQCVDRELAKTTPAPTKSTSESIESVYDDFIEPSASSLSGTTPSATLSATTSAANDVGKGTDPPVRKVIWILAISSGKDIFDILETLVRPSHADQIIFTTFGPVQDMPWVRPTSLDSLISSAEVLDLQYHVQGAVSTIVEALEVAESLLVKHDQQTTQQLPPLIVVAGSLYLVSDFLRFQRDGREAFVRDWNNRAALSTIGETT